MLLLFLSLYFLLFSKSHAQSCGCPAIQTITKAKLLTLPESKYLANRAITNPKVTVSPTCQVTVDCSMMKVTDFHLMIFRKGAPPIFNRRFLKTSKKDVPFSPTGISCVNVNGVYEWQFFGGKLTDMAFALQPTECGCKLKVTYMDRSIVPNAYGACDIFKATCPDKFIPSFFSNTRTYGVPQSRNLLVSDLTCVGNQWYYNNLKDSNNKLEIWCTEQEVSANAVAKVPHPNEYYCGCRDLEQLDYEPTNVKVMLTVLNGAQPYFNRKFRSGTIRYDEKSCTAKITCTGSDTLVMFSWSFGPITYSDGVSNSISCNPTTTHPFPDNTYDTKKQWYVDGTKLNLPVSACLEVAGCECKYIPMTSTTLYRLVGTYSFYPFISTRSLRTPIDDRKETGCPTKVSCPTNFTLVLFDLLNASVFPKAAGLLCKSRKWMIDKKADVPDADILYGICVDLR